MKRETKRRASAGTDRGHRKGAILIGLAILAGLPAFASERQVIPFEFNDQDHMVVQIDLNDGATATGIIDTAATFPMIDGHTARMAGVPELGDNPPMVNVLGLTGAEIYPVVRLDQLAVGNVLKTDLPAALNRRLDVPGAENVLPASAFEGDVIDFDFQNRRVMVYNGRPDRSTSLVPSVQRYDEVDGLLFVDVRINGRKGRALIDTGSNVTYINSRFAYESGTTANEEKTLALFGATGGDQSLRVASAKVVMIGDYRIAKVDILVTDPPLFDYLGIGEEPAMVLGLDLLSTFRMQIDRRRGRLLLSLPEAKNTRSLNLNARDTRIPAY
ncbi:MAG TPA: aspartyl protease family protein [Hyphomonas sp.]|nr:aspartyl protease family protein [Hyphomonas sp.]